ncbi:hypothetical protein [Polycladidibacter stylochi]|uniref:hypothetical protein n=1 Tax=Polycladidibacter stylochi TaxID=1807766 RepID=UPI000833CF30|nr:hypothetical protein [Pseudovibrio stylochi]
MDGMKLLMQSLRVILGYLLALLTAGLYFSYGAVWVSGAGNAEYAYGLTFVGGLLSATLVGAISFFPALLMIVFAEVFRWQSILVHLLYGGGVALIVWSLGGAEFAQQAAFPRPGTSVAMSAGFIAGFVYWLFAGRLSGCWHGRKDVS